MDGYQFRVDVIDLRCQPTLHLLQQHLNQLPLQKQPGVMRQEEELNGEELNEEEINKLVEMRQLRLQPSLHLQLQLYLHLLPASRELLLAQLHSEQISLLMASTGWFDILETHSEVPSLHRHETALETHWQF